MKKISLLFIVAATLLACTKDPAFRDGGSITVEASIGTMTKVTTDGAASSFEAGDKIAVYAWTGDYSAVPAERVVDGIVNTLGGDGKWTPASVMYWKPGSDAHYFLGISPVHVISDFAADAFTLSGTYASDDLLIARNLDGLKPGSGAVALKFAHTMARLTVNVKVRNEFGASPAVSVSVTAKSVATVNYLTQAVTATGDAFAQTLTAATSAPTGYTHSFGGVQVPQSGVRTITITVAGQDFVYEAGDDIPLASGHHTTLGLVLGKDKIELSGVELSDWSTGSDLSGGTASVTKINGHDVVDMGNGFFWATCNVGADNPWDFGDYFAWGETTSKSNYVWGTYKFNPSGNGSTFTKYTTPDAILEASDDAATANWGSDWRTPTAREWAWLRENCNWAWKTTDDGYAHNGMLVTSKINGNQIFLPAAGSLNDATLYSGGSDGFYWSSSLSSSLDARYANFSSSGVLVFYANRKIGMSVRPVAGNDPDVAIVFADSGLKSYLVATEKNPVVDLNHDGEISMAEAAAVTSLATLFDTGSTEGRSYTQFDEFQYFTGIKTLPAGSFNNWTNLTTITLPSSIETIDVDFKDQAGTTPSPNKTIFWNCPKLEYIKGKFSSGDEKALIYRREGETTSTLVKVCETINAFDIPEGVDTIARYCFYNSAIKTVTFPNSLKVIGDCAFEYSEIEKVTFPLGDGSSSANPDVDACRVTTVYERTFAHCYKLKEFKGALVNGTLKVCADGRVLYSGTTVYAYALGSNEKKVIIPDDKGIKRLADCVFEMVDVDGRPLPVEQSKLEVIALPTGINDIGTRTFYNQAGLQRLWFHGAAAPNKCGTEALGNINQDCLVYIPSGADIGSFATKLNYPESQFAAFDVWDP